MFQEQKENQAKRNAKVVIGYDLGNAFSQISYYVVGEQEPKTVSSVAGTEQYNIPTVLCKRVGVGQWFYGKEAIKNAGDDGILVEQLVDKALQGEEVLVEETTFDPVALLTLFVKRSLALLNMQISMSQVEAFMFTVEDLSPRMVEVLSRVVAGLQLKCSKIYFQSHIESFYYYTLRQQQELWKNEVMVFEYNDKLKMLDFYCNRNTTPHVVLIQHMEYEEMKRCQWAQEESLRKEQQQNLDVQFEQICEESLKERNVTTIYLIGDGFKEGWAHDSLRVLCKNRRVFQGNNLYSKGACYGGMEKLYPGEISSNYVYLGEEKLKSNIGMKALRHGEDSYLAILDAGVNWYEAKNDFDVILESGDSISFVITPLTGGKIQEKAVILDGIPERPRSTTRLRIHAEMISVNQLSLEIMDMGFGELFKSSGRGWSHSISV